MSENFNPYKVYQWWGGNTVVVSKDDYDALLELYTSLKLRDDLRKSVEEEEKFSKAEEEMENSHPYGHI
jgi:hypothetical protein